MGAITIMPNPLQTGQGGPPDAPQGGEPQMMQQGLQPQMAPQGPPQPQQMAQPAPTHEQTVAALRHFHAIVDVLRPLIKDPELGKTDVKGKIIDGSTELVAQRIISPAQAVMQLGDVPEKPFDQKQWVVGHYQQAMQAADMVLAHYGAANQGSGDIVADMQQHAPPNPDDHMNHMSSLHDHYKGLGRG